MVMTISSALCYLPCTLPNKNNMSQTPLHGGHATLLCIIPMLVYALPKEAQGAFLDVFTYGSHIKSSVCVHMLLQIRELLQDVICLPHSYRKVRVPQTSFLFLFLFFGSVSPGTISMTWQVALVMCSSELSISQLHSWPGSSPPLMCSFHLELPSGRYFQCFSLAIVYGIVFLTASA